MLFHYRFHKGKGRQQQGIYQFKTTCLENVMNTYMYCMYLNNLADQLCTVLLQVDLHVNKRQKTVSDCLANKTHTLFFA